MRSLVSLHIPFILSGLCYCKSISPIDCVRSMPIRLFFRVNFHDYELAMLVTRTRNTKLTNLLLLFLVNFVFSTC